MAAIAGDRCHQSLKGTASPADLRYEPSLEPRSGSDSSLSTLNKTIWNVPDELSFIESGRVRFSAG